MDNEQIDYKSPSQSSEYGKFAGVIIGIIVFSLLLFYIFDGQSFTNWMQFFMAMFFIVFAGFKFAGYEMFVEIFPSYDIIAKRYKAYAYFYPFIEIFLGFAYLMNAFGSIRDILTVIVMSVSAYGVAQELKRRRGGGVYCACLGNIIKLPLSTISLFENILMGVMALIMLIFG